jgi:protease IV
MKNFFKTVFATMLGCFFSFIVIFIILMVFLISSISFSGKEKEVKLKANTILHLTFDHPILERGSKNPFREIDFATMKPSRALGLNQIVSTIEAAASDPNISAIFLEPALMVEHGFATIEEIRNSLIRFKESGKPVIVYSEMFSQKSYYLATAGDKIYMNPKGMFDFRGLASQLFFMKGTLQKLDIEAQIIRHGKYKSAVEPFTLDRMSDENREQYSAFLNSIWNYYLQNVSDARAIQIETLNQVADSLMVRKPEDAMTIGFVDGLMYKDQVLELLKSESGSVKPANDLESITLASYAGSQKIHEKKLRKDKIAVIYAVGDIGSGQGSEDAIGSEKISRTIRLARNDDQVKAIVLRVNSPGGSALASEVIWKEVQLTSAVKPVVVSMGDVAASGGYYIACPATKIVAQPNTVTGSIGVFGVMLNMGEFFKNKMGITFDVVKTNNYADMFTMVRPLSVFELKVLQSQIEDIYDTFVKRVAEGRNMSVEDIEKISQGRIWSGIEAKNAGLVDELGGLNDAIRLASELAGIKEYSILELPRQKEFFEEFLSDLMGRRLSDVYMKRLLQLYPFINSIEPVQSRDPFMTRMEFDFQIE